MLNFSFIFGIFISFILHILFSCFHFFFFFWFSEGSKRFPLCIPLPLQFTIQFILVRWLLISKQPRACAHNPSICHNNQRISHRHDCLFSLVVLSNVANFKPILWRSLKCRPFMPRCFVDKWLCTVSVEWEAVNNGGKHSTWQNMNKKTHLAGESDD